MASVYDALIDELKNILNNKNIKFNALINLINNHDYDEAIHSLIAKIIAQRENIGNTMEKNLNDLAWLNKMLVLFGEKPQPSKTKALKVLKTKVFINIYDLAAEKYEMRTTKQKLIEQLRNYPEKRFPLWLAKKHKRLTSFLTSYRSKA